MPREDWIVLVEPREPAIVGAVARAMRNFGFRSLALVGASLPALDDEAFRWASGADGVLLEARRLDSIESVVDLADRTVAILNEARSIDGPRNEFADIASLAGKGVALVFEPDHRRLRDDELASCIGRLVLPGEGMSVAQRVALACWERSGIGITGDVPEPADEGSIERITDRTAAILDRVMDAGVDSRSQGAVRRDEAADILRLLLERANPTAREATMILGVLRQMSWALDQGPRETIG